MEHLALDSWKALPSSPPSPPSPPRSPRRRNVNSISIGFVFLVASLCGTRSAAGLPTHHVRGGGDPTDNNNNNAVPTAAAAADKEFDPTTMVRLHNGEVLPLRGLGVGNLQHELIPTIVREGLRLGLRLIDTAHASHNEALIDQSVAAAASATTTSDQHVDVHVVTKVWYTHLGYERTIHSVRESMEALSHVDKIHVLLHWPRCSNDIAWMDCTGEEDALPAHVQALGPAPHLQPQLAYLDSWRAMEDLYDDNTTGRLASIGVSNFDLSDLQALLAQARIVPHIIQLNVWSLLFDPDLIQLCRHHNIHVQVYNVMNGIFGRATTHSPQALHRLVALADEAKVTPVQLVVAWLVQQGVSVIPRTTSASHLHDNAAAVPVIQMPDDDDDILRRIVTVLLQDRDLDPPVVMFVSRHDVPVSLFWQHDESGEEHSVRPDLQPGESFHSDTYPGHVFVVYESSSSNHENEQEPSTPRRRREFRISAGFGDEQEIHIEL
jgi:diketogulonate reductase-like aldo/keto reductase